MRFILTSQSSLKKDIVFQTLKDNFIGFTDKDLISLDSKGAATPPQPVGDTSIMTCACKRIMYIEGEYPNLTKDDIIISIENGLIVNTDDSISDVCCVVLYLANSFQTHKYSKGINLPTKYFNQAALKTPDDYNLKHLGLAITAGELIHNEYPEIPANNWMGDKKFGSHDRKDQIYEPLMECINEYKVHLLKNNLLYFNDFPKKGVMFKDLSGIIKEGNLLRYLVDLMTTKITHQFSDTKIDKIVGLDARGFIYGPLLAFNIGSGFVMARKSGKLPSKAKSVDYSTEYSNNTIEIMENVIDSGDNVIIMDDLVATGGSLCAAKKLVESVGGNVIGCCCILQVDPLLPIAIKKLNGTPLLVVLT